MKTIVAVLLTQFDLAIVDPTTPTATTTTTATTTVNAKDDSVRGVFDTREDNGPGINGARAGGSTPIQYLDSPYHQLLP